MPQKNPSRRRPSLRGLATALVAVAALLTPLSATNAQTSAPATTDRHGESSSHGAKPTIVLVHGAWADSSGWSGVITRLQRRGFTVLAVANPLRGLSADSAYVRAFLETVPGPIVLVGHSYGGAVITNAATGNENVRALVYVDAFAPDKGETVNSLVGAGSALAGDPATLFDVRPYPGAPTGDADVYLKPSVVTDFFAQDLPRREALVLAATQRPLTLAAGTEPSGEPAWKTIPSWYLLGTRDRIITPASQLFMAERAGADITRVRASHVSMISHPEAVVRLIRVATRATR
ncbi:alpha/beta hydrolase [Nocardioides sp. CER19]|uniref:alpha/beta fold hydrolase n=1 Tax=Nocardioides sp. CER19 TaxID=3038538 RepID=UPI00244C1842|nr:alpha/beta hydrolase [Nocardioides sp. CER19]MDH2415236.1 alpha/beta hydrolase [Nocardioides sp. CER19]